MSEGDWYADPGTDIGDDGDLPDDPLIEGDDGGGPSEDLDPDEEDWEREADDDL